MPTPDDAVGEAVIHCARHPNVETLLRCGRCDTPICPKCLVITDVGARCPDCAPRRKLPQFEVGPIYFLRGLAAAAAVGAAIGGLWGLLLPAGTIGLFSVFVGLGLGWALAESVSLATNRKFGPILAGQAALGVMLAYVVRNLFGGDAIVPSSDLGGYIAVGVGVAFAISRLRT